MSTNQESTNLLSVRWLSTPSFAWLMMVAALSSTVLLVVATDEGGDCSRDQYLAPSPRTLEDFNRTVINGDEVFLVRFHSEDSLQSRGFASAWEKLAIVYHKKVRFVQYRLTEALGAEMAKEFGITLEDLPHLTLYPRRSKFEHEETPKVVEAASQLAECQSEGTGSLEECQGLLNIPSAAAVKGEAARDDAIGDEPTEAELRRNSTDAAKPVALIRGRLKGGWASIAKEIDANVQDFQQNSEGFFVKAVV